MTGEVQKAGFERAEKARIDWFHGAVIEAACAPVEQIFVGIDLIENDPVPQSVVLEAAETGGVAGNSAVVESAVRFFAVAFEAGIVETQDYVVAESADHVDVGTSLMQDRQWVQVQSSSCQNPVAFPSPLIGNHLLHFHQPHIPDQMALTKSSSQNALGIRPCCSCSIAGAGGDEADVDSMFVADPTLQFPALYLGQSFVHRFRSTPPHPRPHGRDPSRRYLRDTQTQTARVLLDKPCVLFFICHYDEYLYRRIRTYPLKQEKHILN